MLHCLREETSQVLWQQLFTGKQCYNYLKTCLFNKSSEMRSSTLASAANGDSEQPGERSGEAPSAAICVMEAKVSLWGDVPSPSPGCSGEQKSAYLGSSAGGGTSLTDLIILGVCHLFSVRHVSRDYVIIRHRLTLPLRISFTFSYFLFLHPSPTLPVQSFQMCLLFSTVLPPEHESVACWGAGKGVQCQQVCESVNCLRNIFLGSLSHAV